ncbi:hypothetical protein S-CBP2_0038 [Synechococcus phage S-CBP2]|uniref:Internal virion protein n=1 Tax=Synechococcus phage S-CBP2 TaxID=756277 RepID=A0A096VL03_9CAUD|nr:hypothetical protein S-CBP2_0038 [Synechococcus phage S-CBP2]AGF91079.1 hypothetical protein SXHG_00057 [Synechococcus phage MRHenn-2013a]AGK86744.1 hypothetical protein S-CBP2_0038 [Synechococcus phage S-CBP2]
MCAPVVIGIATAVIGGLGTIASYQQQQAQTTAANNAAWQQTVYQNKQIANQSQQALRQNIFQLQQNNRAVEFQNQNILQQSIIAMDETVRSNLRAHQEWQYAVTQNDYQNLNQQLEYTQQLNRSTLSKQVAEIQQQMNQRGLSAELEEAQRRLRDAAAVAAFEGERLMVSNLTATGSVLATGKSGGSIGLAAQSLDAAYGRDMSMLDTNFGNAKEGFFSEVTNAFTKKVQSDWEAVSNIIPEPSQPIGIPAPMEPVYASMPKKPIFAPMQTELAPWSKPLWAPAPSRIPGPSGIGLVAGIGSSIMGGISAGMQAQSMIPKPGGKID